MRIKTWVAILENAPAKVRKQLRKAVVEGMKYFNAEWVASPAPTKDQQIPGVSPELMEMLTGEKYMRVKKYDDEVLEFVDWVDSEQDTTFIGTTPEICYLKNDGTKEQLGCEWEHQFGSAMNLYIHKRLPMIIIAGPNIMYNDSMAHQLNPKGTIEKGLGIMD